MINIILPCMTLYTHFGIEGLQDQCLFVYVVKDKGMTV